MERENGNEGRMEQERKISRRRRGARAIRAAEEAKE